MPDKENRERRGELGREGVGRTADADVETQERDLRREQTGERARTRPERYDDL